MVYLINKSMFHNTPDGWIFWCIGLFITVFFEQIANYHYMSYSKIANKMSVDRVLKNIMINKALRIIAITGFIFCIFAVAIMVVSTNGTIANIWG